MRSLNPNRSPKLRAALLKFGVFPGTSDASLDIDRRPGIIQHIWACLIGAGHTVVSSQRCNVTAASTAAVRTQLSVAWQVVR